MIHELKIKPEYFAAVVSGDKTFEIRNNADRNFQVGDALLLWEWNGGFTGQTAERTVSYITDFEQKPGYVVLGLANKREQELAEQLADATRQCGVMAELLREQREGAEIHLRNCKILKNEEGINNWTEKLARIDSVLAGKIAHPAVTVTETIRTAPERIWLQVGDSQGDNDLPFPDDHGGVSWCDEQVMPCEVPYVRADLAAAIPAPVVPEGWKIVPLEPEGEQWGGLARAIIFWMRSYQSNEHTPATLEDFITRLGNTIPDWMKKESEFGDKGHVISKGTAAAFIYKAMLADAPKPPIVKLARFITEGQELELTTVLQSIVNGFSDDPAHDAAALLKRITGEVPWTGDSFQLPPRQGGEPCAIEPRSSSPA